MLDEKIREAINQNAGNYLVIGPPGAGKTYTLIELTKYLIEVKRIDPTRILIFCFNRRWAKIIREKTTSYINSSILEIPIKTFYSFCIDFIEETSTILFIESFSKHGYKGNILASGKSDNNVRENVAGDLRYGFGGVKVLNSTQQWKLLKSVIDDLDSKNYPYTFKYIKENPFIASSYIQEIFDFILRAQENLLSPRDLSTKFTPFFSPVLSEIVGIYSRYRRELYKKNIYNYGRLLEDTVDILKNHKSIRERYRNSFDYILVDELQEINKAQLEIVRYLAGGNCIYFGNDDESIYTFRGSMIDNFKSIYNKLPVENVLFLDRNYRSSWLVNEISRKFISINRDRILKNCVSARGKNKNDSGEVILKRFHNLLEEANFVCRKIKYLCLRQGLNLEDIAVIVKGLGYETHLIENALLQNNIPFIRRGSRDILDNKYIKYIINFMRLVLFIDSFEKEFSSSGRAKENSKINSLVENILLSEVINLEPLYFKKLKFYLGSDDINGNKNSKNLWEQLKNVCKKNNKNNIEQDIEFKKIVDFIDAVHEYLQIINQPVNNFVLKLIRDERVGVISRLISEHQDKIYVKNLWDNLGDFLESVNNFVENSNSNNDVNAYIEFLDDIFQSQFLEEIEESTKDYNVKGAIRILSFHQCKGLEFKAVFLPFINKGYLPSRLSLPQTYDMQIFNYFAGDGRSLDPQELAKKHLEEERKLFYIGITRAANYLYITANYSKESSIFFEELENIYRNVEQEKTKDYELHDKNYGILGKNLKWDIDLTENWLIRKRAIVGTYRLVNNLKLNVGSYVRQLIFLKYFYPPLKWWSFIKQTTNDVNPFSIFSTPFSYSSLDTFKECPFKYKLKYFISLEEEESLSLIVGKIYHEILRVFFESNRPEYKGKEFSWELLREKIIEVFNRYEFKFKFVKNELMEKALIEFRNFYENYLPSNPDNSIMEKRFSFCIGDECINGRIDQVNFVDDENVELVDYKSSSTRLSNSDLKDEIQLKIYRLATELSEDLHFLKGKKIKLRYFFLGCLSNPVSEVPEEYYNSGEVTDLIKTLISKIKREEFDPNPEGYMACKACDYKILCPKYYGEKF